MKKNIRSYSTFTRAERTGLAGLCALLLLLIGIRATMYLWVLPANSGKNDEKLDIAIASFRNNYSVNDSGLTQQRKDYEDAFDDNKTPLSDKININTADSETLIRLKGIGPVTASKIIARRKIKPFTNVDQLLTIRHFPDATFKVLKAHLVTGQ